MASVSGETVVDDTPVVPLPYTRRWLPEMWDDWLMMRLEDRWPGKYTEQAWKGKFAGFSQNNEFLFVTNGDAVFFAYQFRDVITGDPVIYERFAWSRSARQDKTGRTGNWLLDDERPLVALYRHAKQWAMDLHGLRITGMGTCSDLSPSKLRQLMQGDYLVDLVL